MDSASPGVIGSGSLRVCEGSMPTPTTYDPLFDKYRGRIPKAFLRALAQQESNMNPNAHKGTGGRGLLQITGIAREDFNQRNGTAYTINDLFQPEVSIRIGAELLNRIVAAYGKHPSANMHEDWTNPEFVKLVTMGWNAGHSEGGGVGRVAAYLESRGQPVTHDAIFKTAAAAGGVAKLSNALALQWQRGVLALFRKQPDWKGPAVGLGTVLVLIGLGWAALKYKLIA